MVLGVLLRGCWITFSFFFEIVNMWKLAPRVHESSIFKVWRGLVLYIFVIFWGLVSGWLREWILSDFGMDFGASKDFGTICGVRFVSQSAYIFFLFLCWKNCPPQDAQGVASPWTGVTLGTLSFTHLGVQTRLPSRCFALSQKWVCRVPPISTLY